MSSFEYDELEFKKGFVRTLVTEFCATVFLVVMSVLFQSSKLVTLILTLTVLIALVFLWDLLSFSSRFRNIRSSSVIIDQEKLSIAGKDTFSLPISDIGIKKVIKNQSGNVVLILLKTNFNQKLKIVGLKNMDKAYKEISEAIQ